MTIQVLFFASLREQLGRAEYELDGVEGLRVLDVWNQATDDADWPANIICAVNKEYCDPEDPVTDGDEVAFFPPVTGG